MGRDRMEKVKVKGTQAMSSRNAEGRGINFKMLVLIKLLCRCYRSHGSSYLLKGEKRAQSSSWLKTDTKNCKLR